MNKKFTKLMAALALLVFMTPSLEGWGQTRTEEVYSTCLFGIGYGVSNNYTSTWNTYNGDFTWSVSNGNTNYQSGSGTSWNYVKFGRKDVASVGSITTSENYSEAITKVDLTIDALTASKINSITLYTSTDNSNWNSAGTFTKAAGKQTVSINTPIADLYYKIEFDCASGSSNGLITVSKVEYYHNAGGDTPSITISGDEIQNDKVTLNWNDQEVYTADVVYGNMDTPSSDDVTVGVYSDESCETVFTGNWFTADFATNSVESIEYAFLENNASSDSRTVYMRVETYNAEETDLVPCNVIAITQSAQPQVATPTFSPAAGAVSVGTTVTLSCATADATIVYSVNDGDMIEQTSPVQITINEDTEIEAFATASGYRDSETVTANYTLRGNAVFVDGVYYESIESQASFDNMEVVNIVGENQNWHYDLDEEAAYINGYNSGKVDNYDWLISPKMVVENGKLSISFLVWHNYADNQLSLKWSTSNNVNGQWYDLEFDEGARNSQNFVHVDNIIIESNDPVYVAFVYDNRASTSAALYEICQFKAKQCHTLTVSDLVNVNTFVFADDENNMLLEGEGLASVGVSSNVMVSVEVSEDYVLSSLMVDDEDHKNDISGGMYTFTMPNHNVTVTATATRRPYYTVTFTTNGIDDVTMEVNQGAPIGSLPIANASYIPEGYTFVGWLDSEYPVSDAAPDTYITSADIPQGDVTLYAVFAIPGESSYTLVGPGDVTEGIYLIGALRSTTATNNFYFADGTTSSGDMNTNSTATEIAENSGVRQITAKPTNAQEFEFVGNSTDGFAIRKINTTSYLGYSSNANRKLAFGNNYSSIKWSAKSKNSPLLTNGIYLETSNYKVSENSTDVTAIRGYYNGSAYRAIYLFKKTETSTNYRTSLIESCTLTITGYDDGGGWNLIASPVTVTPATVEGMVVANTDENYEYFDLYYFDQTGGLNGKEWKNYKASHFNLVPGTGYLYANKTGGTYTLAGTSYSGNGEVGLVYSEDNEDVNMRGWNLIGNPFNSAVTIEERDFYIMNDDHDQIILADANHKIIAPMQGIFVQAASVSESVTFTEVTQNANANSGTPALTMNLLKNRGNVIDRAIVRFGEGRQLSKLQLFKNSTKLYFAQNNEEMAVVRSEAQGEMPVNFKAAENGTYTLTVNPEGVEMNYLHLIDNMTGMDVDLLQTPSYTFNATTRDYESRFRLVFAANNENGVSAGSTTFAYFSNGSLVVNNEGNATLQVVDVMGRIVKSESINGSASINVNAAPGVYTLRLVNGNDVKTQKVVVR